MTPCLRADIGKFKRLTVKSLVSSVSTLLQTPPHTLFQLPRATSVAVSLQANFICPTTSCPQTPSSCFHFPRAHATKADAAMSIPYGKVIVLGREDGSVYIAPGWTGLTT